MIAAAIDLGTNTFHLIIANLSAAGIEILHKRNEPVKLGEGRINENIITPEAFQRGLRTLESFQDDLTSFQAAVVKATATSAVRSAKNGTQFVLAAKERSGIDIEVITGEQEAEYIFNGVKGSGMLGGRTLIMDIGGGSTEFMLCDEDQMVWKQSFDIGAARLMQAYFHSDPIHKKEINSILDHLNNVLPPLLEACATFKPTKLIGSAGAFESFAALILETTYSHTKVESGKIDLTKYRNLSEKLIASTHQQRADMRALIPLRVDMIVIASILTNYIIDRLEIEALSLSTYDLKMGLLYSLNSHKGSGTVFP